MRKTKEVTISADNRDKGKTFLITEMPADQGERWGIRAILALTKNGIRVPDDLETQGLAGLATLSLATLGGMAYEDAGPLLDEMMECVQIKEAAVTRKLFPTDIEEIATRMLLRGEVLALHLGFSLGDAGSRLKTMAALARQLTASPKSATSHEPLAP